MARTARKKITILSGGVSVVDDTDFIDFEGSGVSVTPSGAGVDVTVSGGGSITILTTSSTIDGTNTAFVFASKPEVIVVNGASYRENHGWSWNSGTSTATLDNAVGVGGDIYGISS